VVAVVAGSLTVVVVMMTEMRVAAGVANVVVAGVADVVVVDVGAVAGYVAVNAVGGVVVAVPWERAKSYRHKAKGQRDEVTATYCEVDTVQKMVQSIVAAMEHVFVEHGNVRIRNYFCQVVLHQH